MMSSGLGGTRTRDFLLRRQALYPLNYEARVSKLPVDTGVCLRLVHHGCYSWKLDGPHRQGTP